MISDDTSLKGGSKQKYTPRLSKESKDAIERIAAICGYKYSTVKDIFLAISVAVNIEMYSGTPEIILPYLFTVKLNENCEAIEVVPDIALKNIIAHIHDKESTWVEDYLRNSLSILGNKFLNKPADEII
jgi:hypothetical protein